MLQKKQLESFNPRRDEQEVHVMGLKRYTKADLVDTKNSEDKSLTI